MNSVINRALQIQKMIDALPSSAAYRLERAMAAFSSLHMIQLARRAHLAAPGVRNWESWLRKIPSAEPTLARQIGRLRAVNASTSELAGAIRYMGNVATFWERQIEHHLHQFVRALHPAERAIYADMVDFLTCP